LLKSFALLDIHDFLEKNEILKKKFKNFEQILMYQFESFGQNISKKTSRNSNEILIHLKLTVGEQFKLRSNCTFRLYLT
jgi:hypothetical protein